MPCPLITLTTDFGTGSPYVAAMKGVLYAVNPAVQLVDLSHEIPPQQIRAAALFLAEAVPYFPSGTIHLVVVDPGVGTTRRALYAASKRQQFVGPDNGLFSLLLGPDRELVELTRPEFWRTPLSATFHGRDLFAPVAAHLSLGLSPLRLGTPVTDLVELDWPVPQIQSKCIQGEILWLDRYGNLISNIHRDLLPNAGTFIVRCGDAVIQGIKRTYGESPTGTLIALFGSSGRLEVAEVGGNAGARLGLGVGAAISLLC